MKDFFKNIISKIKTTGITKIDTSYLKDNSWFYISDDIIEVKTVYIFRANGELLISKRGDITKAKWENLVHSNNSLIIEIETPILYNIFYLTSDYLIIQKDGTEHFELFVKQEKFNSKIKIDKEIKVNLIDYAFEDLKKILNSQNNNDEIGFIPINTEVEASFFEKEEDLLFNQVVEREPEIIPIEKRKVVKVLKNDDNYEYFDVLDLLEKEKRSGKVSNQEQEVDFIVEMQEKEEELLEDKVLCPYCKALNSIENNTCKVCSNNV